MKAQNTKWSFKNWPTLSATFLVLFSLMFIATGCGKRKHSNVNPYLSPYGYGTCTSCPAGSQFMMSALGQKLSLNGMPIMELSLEFYAAGGAQPLTTGTTYNGPVSAQGILHVMQGDPICNLPPGQYHVTTLTPGQMQDQSIFNLMLQGGPAGGAYGAGMQIAVPNNFVTASTQAKVGVDGRTYPFRLQNFIYINTNSCRYMLE